MAHVGCQPLWSLAGVSGLSHSTVSDRCTQRVSFISKLTTSTFTDNGSNTAANRMLPIVCVLGGNKSSEGTTGPGP